MIDNMQPFERLNKYDASRSQSIFIRLAIVTALGLLLFVVRKVAANNQIYYDAHVWWELSAAILAALLLTFSPLKWRWSLQTLALISVFFASHIQHNTELWPVLSLITIGLPAILVILLRFMPLKTKAVFRSTLTLTILAVPLLMWALYKGFNLQDFVLDYLVLLIMSSCSSFLLTAASIHKFEIPQNWQSALRPMTVSSSGLGPLPVNEALSMDFSIRVILLGAIWILGGVALRGLSIILWHIDLEPVQTFASGHVFLSLLVALAHWARSIGTLMSFFAMTCGCARLMGVPVSYPILQPWLATSFADYWKRANYVRYSFFQKVFWNAFGPTMPPMTLALRIFGIFFISSILNIHHGFSVSHFLRWLIEAIMTIISMLIIRAMNM